MESITTLITLAGIAAMGIMTPGPDFVAVSHASLTAGRAQASCVAVGVVLGNGIWAGAALFGVGVLFTLFPTFFIGFKVLGGAYLIWMGIKMLRAARTNLVATPDSIEPSLGRGALKGLSTTLANPKAAIYYASALSTVAPADASLQLLLLMLLTVIGVATLWFSCVVFLLSTPKASAMYQRFKLYLESLFGSLIIVFGARQLPQQ